MNRTTAIYRQLVIMAVGMLVAVPFSRLQADTATPVDKLAAAASENRLQLGFDGDTFSGPGWDRLLAEGARAQFFLVGEEHGIAENPRLVAQLFAALASRGYGKLAIEISPPMARIVDSRLKVDGLAGLKTLFAEPGGEPAFFGMREEAAMLAAVRAALPQAGQVFWGLDYEVASDRQLLQALRQASPPPGATRALEALAEASDASWATYDATHGPQHIFSFAGDPALVTAVRQTWPDADDDVRWILETLQTTLEINRHWVEGRGWVSNAHRAAFIRSNFLRQWRAATGSGHAPRVMVKMGANHVVRGFNKAGTFDLGTLLPEIAALEGSRSVSLLILPGKGSLTAVLNPSTWTYEPKPAKDGYALGLGPITGAAFADAFTLIDLVPLRSIVGSRDKEFGRELLRVVHGFDMLLVMSGSTASTAMEKTR